MTPTVYTELCQRVIDSVIIPMAGNDAPRILNRLKMRLAAELPLEHSQPYTQMVDNALDKLSEANKLDAEVKAILDSEPYKSERLQMEQDRLIFDRAMGHIDWNIHQNWEIKGHSSLFPEPKPGKYDPEGYDLWLNKNNTEHLKPALDELQRQRSLLNNMFKQYKSETWGAKPVTLTIQGKKHPLVEGRIQL